MSNETVRYDDAIVRRFVTATMVWGAVGMLVGLWCALQLALPSLNVGPYFTFGRLRPLHTNAVIFAFAGNGTPLAVTVALGRAARRGILIKGADALERLATPGTMFVDKTGTLTEGRLAVASWHGDVDARELAAAVEAGSAHPIARAITMAVPPLDLVATEIHEELGQGIRGLVRGHRVLVGSPSWVRSKCTRARDDVDAWIADVTRGAETPVAVAVDGAIVAIAGLADPIRIDARVAIRQLERFGWRVEILSGDDRRVVHAVGEDLELPPERCTGEVPPELKLAIVNEAREHGPVAMVGDGVNDAAAIAAATCGIAVSGAAEVAIDAADVYLREPSIGAIAATTSGATETSRRSGAA